jgi:hypothetical protein
MSVFKIKDYISVKLTIEQNTKNIKHGGGKIAINQVS